MADICPTTRIQKLLLSTDGSEHSEGAIREALRLAKSCSTSLAVMTVVETNPEFGALAPQLVEKSEKAARQHLDSVKERARKESVDVETIVHEGEDSYREIVDEAARRKTTTIVMGRRGRTGIKRLMMGSTTARVIGHAPCNVLVVPRAAQVEFKNILVATDGSRYGMAAASEALGIAKRCGSTVTVVSVVPSETAAPMDIVQSQMQRGQIADKEIAEAEKNVKAVKEAAQNEGVKITALVYSGRPAEAIVDAAREKKADLIIVGSHGKAGLDKLLVGSVAERVIVLSPVAVLVVKPQA